MKNRDECKPDEHDWHSVWKAINNYVRTFYCKKCWKEKK